MSMYCRDLFNMKTLRGIKIVAGKDGLDRKITWAYASEDVDVSTWGMKGELLFVTGKNMDKSSETFYRLIDNCIESGLAGIVISVNDDYIGRIQDDVKEYADRKKFPIFTIPWSIRRIDVMRELSNVIVTQHQKNNKKDELLNLLKTEEFWDDTDRYEKKFYELLGELGVKLDVDCCCISIVMETFGIKKLNIDRIHDSYVKNLKDVFFKNKLVDLSDRNNVYVFIFGRNEDREFRDAVEKVIKITESAVYSEKGGEIYIGLGFQNEKILKSLVEAKNASGIYKRLKRPGKVAVYNKLGFFRRIYNDMENGDLREYSLEVLKPFIEYDTSNADKFMIDTIVAYYENMFNISRTAKALYIHRNSLMYRLNKIEELAQTDITAPYDMLDIVCCAVAYKYFM